MLCPSCFRVTGPSRWLPAQKFSSQHLYESVLMDKCITFTSVTASLTLKGTYRFRKDLRCHLDVFRDVPACPSSTMPSHTLRICQHGFRVKLWVLNRPACSPDLHPTENMWFIMKYKRQYQSPRIVE